MNAWFQKKMTSNSIYVNEKVKRIQNGFLRNAYTNRFRGRCAITDEDELLTIEEITFH